MAGESKTTTDHQEIRSWVEQRSGKPATVTGTSGDEEAGILRINFPGYSGEQSLKELSWDGEPRGRERLGGLGPGQVFSPAFAGTAIAVQTVLIPLG